MTVRHGIAWSMALALSAVLGCGDDVGTQPAGAGSGDGAGAGGLVAFVPNVDELPAAGNPDGHCDIPADARLEDSSKPDHVVGTGSQESCTSDAFVEAVAQGGVITFNCGKEPVTITLDRTAKIVNDTGPKIVIDGGSKVTLSGGGKVRILYQDTCDEKQKWTTSHCDNQDHPQLTVQNLTFLDGSVRNEIDANGNPAGGGAIFASGGRLKIINSRFFHNETADAGELASGGAVRAFQQSDNLPLYVVNSTFGGSEELGNVAANGGGLSSIGVSYTVINSLFSHNRAVGSGGGGGGGIYNDGNTYTLNVCGTKMEHNSCTEGGGAIFYVSNDGSGTLIIKDSTLTNNPNDGFDTAGFPGIFWKTDQAVQASGSTITK